MLSIGKIITSLMRTGVAGSAIVAAGAAAAFADDSNVFDGKTHVTVAPFVWVPTISGTLDIRTRDVSAEIAPGAYLKALSSLVLVDAEVRRGNVAFLADYVNFNLNAAPTSSLALHVVPQFLTLGPSFTVVHTSTAVLNFFVGARVALLTARGTIQPDGAFCKNGTFSDGLLGIYGHIALAKHLSIPYYVDAGIGMPNFTWQGYTGIRYGRLTASYRYLRYTGDSNLLLQDLRLEGPELGYSLEF